MDSVINITSVKYLSPTGLIVSIAGALQKPAVHDCGLRVHAAGVQVEFHNLFPCNGKFNDPSYEKIVEFHLHTRSTHTQPAVVDGGL